jgi:hypothetical protein
VLSLLFRLGRSRSAILADDRELRFTIVAADHLRPGKRNELIDAK